MLNNPLTIGEKLIPYEIFLKIVASCIDINEGPPLSSLISLSKINKTSHTWISKRIFEQMRFHSLTFPTNTIYALYNKSLQEQHRNNIKNFYQFYLVFTKCSVTSNLECMLYFADKKKLDNLNSPLIESKKITEYNLNSELFKNLAESIKKLKKPTLLLSTNPDLKKEIENFIQKQGGLLPQDSFYNNFNIGDRIQLPLSPLIKWHSDEYVKYREIIKIEDLGQQLSNWIHSIKIAPNENLSTLKQIKMAIGSCQPFSEESHPFALLWNKVLSNSLIDKNIIDLQKYLQQLIRYIDNPSWGNFIPHLTDDKKIIVLNNADAHSNGAGIYCLMPSGAAIMTMVAIGGAFIFAWNATYESMHSSYLLGLNYTSPKLCFNLRREGTPIPGCKDLSYRQHVYTYPSFLNSFPGVIILSSVFLAGLLGCNKIYSLFNFDGKELDNIFEHQKQFQYIALQALYLLINIIVYSCVIGFWGGKRRVGSRLLLWLC